MALTVHKKIAHRILKGDVFFAGPFIYNKSFYLALLNCNLNNTLFWSSFLFTKERSPNALPLSLPCFRRVSLGLASMSMGIVSLTQVTVGLGSPPASQTSTALRPFSTTFMAGFWMMVGKPDGSSFSAKDEDLWRNIKTINRRFNFVLHYLTVDCSKLHPGIEFLKTINSGSGFMKNYHTTSLSTPM